MTTTLNRIRSHSPCAEGWAKLLKHLNKTTADDEPLSLLTVLASNGLADAIWCLRAEPTPERIQRFALAVARRVEHLHSGTKALNDATERYLNGTATKAELNAARATYRVAAAADTSDASHAARVAAALAAADAADAAHAAAAALAAVDAADTALYAVYAAADAVHAAAAELEAQAQIFKEIFA